MKILVTGASGFLGKNIQQHFKHKYELINVSTSSEKNYIKLPHNLDNIDKKLENIEIDYIIHLASVIPKSFAEASFSNVFFPNAQMMDNLYNFALKKNIKKFIYISSFGSMVDYKNYKIKDYYTLSKIHGEHVCAMMEDVGIETASLRISSPYGPNSNSRSVINIFIDSALKNLDINVYGSGKRQQNFIYVEDITNAINLFILSNNKISGVYNIVSPNNTSMLMLAETIKDICNSKSEIIVGKHVDPQEYYKPNYDYNRAFEEVGYKPNYNIYTGMKKYIEWYVKNR